MIRLGLIAVLLVGLAVTTPVVCVCAPSDHAGMAVHPLFPHTHASDAEHPGHADFSSESAEGLRDSSRSPQVSVQTGGDAAAVGAGAIGLMLVTPWTITPIVQGRAWTPEVLGFGHPARPPRIPPPR